MSDFRSQGMEGDRGVRWRGYIGARGNMDGGGGEMDDKAEIPRGGGTNNVSRYA